MISKNFVFIVEQMRRWQKAFFASKPDTEERQQA